MSDIFEEVDEDLNRERLKTFWDAYGNYVIGAAVAIVLFVAGNEFWSSYQTGKQRQLSESYLTAVDDLIAGKNVEAIAEFEALAGKTTSGYKALALLQKGAALTKEGKVQEAVGLYDELAAGGTGDEIFRDLAKLRAGWILADSASYTEIQERVSELADGDSAFSLSAQELLAYSAMRSGNTEEARIRLGGLVNNMNTPQGIRQRASVMLAAIGPAKPATAEAEVTETEPAVEAGEVASEEAAASETTAPETTEE